MKTERRAVIDIGTNSIKLLVADVSGPAIHPVLEQSKQTRLGQGFYQDRRLQPGPIAQTAQAVTAFATLARQQGAASLQALATSAVREAVNSADLLRAVSIRSGLVVEIISGEQEARWAFEGVTSDPELSSVPMVLLEVGGGSTQFSVGSEGRLHFYQSFPLGTVRLIENTPHSDPPTAGELARARSEVEHFFTTRVRPLLFPALQQEAAPGTRRSLQFVGTGGTATILGRMETELETFDRQRIETVRLNLKRIQKMTAQLWSLPLGERQKIPGLPPNRADVILGGIIFYETAMRTLTLPELRISTRGLRFGALSNRG